MQLKIKEDAGNIFFKNHYKDRHPEHCMPAVTPVPIEGVSDNGLRILDFKGELSIIEEIIDDARPIRAKCENCGHYLRKDDFIGYPCWWCGK